MNVSLTPELEKLVNSKVRSGHYGSASEVIREALRLLIQQDQLREMKVARLLRMVETGLKEADEGKLVPGDKVFDRLRSRNKSHPSRK